MKFVVIAGTVRSARQGIKAARFVERTLTARGHEVSLVDPVELNLPLLDRMYKEYPKGQAPEPLERLATRYRASDGFVVVCGEYNHSIPPALSNLLDHFLEEYFFRPSGIVCYSAGPFGGVRAAMQMRAMLGELGTPSVPGIFAIPSIRKALSDAGEPLDPGVQTRFERFAKEFEWYAGALRDARLKGVPY